MYWCPISFLLFEEGLLFWNDFFPGSAEAPTVFVPARVEFFNVLLDEDGAALDLLKLFDSFVCRLFLLAECPIALGGELNGPVAPTAMLLPPYADVLEL